MDGDEDFFRVTKRLHNRLHGHRGDGGPLGAEERASYERRCASNAEQLVERLGAGDVVLLHDPQTAGMVSPVVAAGVPVIWRAHVGLDLPNDLAREAWSFLTPYVEQADAYVFSRASYGWEGLDQARTTVIPPSIDAFSPKNHAMSYTSVTAVLRAAGPAADHHRLARAVYERLDGSTGEVERSARVIEEQPLRLDVPLVAQVSRWDRLKDPLGVLAGFAEHVDPADEPHLILAGPDVTAVADDPEGGAVLAETEAAWRELPGSRTRSRTARRARSWIRTTCARSGSTSAPCWRIRTARSASAWRPRRACETTSSAPAISASTSTCSRPCSPSARRRPTAPASAPTGRRPAGAACGTRPWRRRGRAVR
jgi:trehalose synthase